MNVVSLIFPQSSTLINFLQQCYKFEGSDLILPDDSELYRNILLQSLIIPNIQSNDSLKSIENAEKNGDQRFKNEIRDVINRVVIQCVRSNQKYRQQNCLSLGYRWKTTQGGSALKDCMDIECHFVNTLHTMITTKTWQTLLARIGETVLRAILSRPLLLPSTNGCYFQISGLPVSEMIFQKNLQFSELSSKATLKLFQQYFEAKVDQKLADGKKSHSNTFLASLLSSLTPIPRYKIFYQLNGRFKDGILNKPINRKAKNAQASQEHQIQKLLIEIFSKELLNIIKDLDDHQLHNSFEAMVKNLLKCHMDCNRKFLLDKFCPNPPLDEWKSPSSEVPSLDEVSCDFIPIQPVMKSKKRRRGCRSGVQKKSKKTHHHAKIPWKIPNNRSIDEIKVKNKFPKKFRLPSRPDLISAGLNQWKQVESKLSRDISLRPSSDKDKIHSQELNGKVMKALEYSIERLQDSHVATSNTSLLTGSNKESFQDPLQLTDDGTDFLMSNTLVDSNQTIGSVIISSQSLSENNDIQPTICVMNSNIDKENVDPSLHNSSPPDSLPMSQNTLILGTVCGGSLKSSSPKSTLTPSQITPFPETFHNPSQSSSPDQFDKVVDIVPPLPLNQQVKVVKNQKELRREGKRPWVTPQKRKRSTETSVAESKKKCGSVNAQSTHANENYKSSISMSSQSKTITPPCSVPLSLDDGAIHHFNRTLQTLADRQTKSLKSDKTNRKNNCDLAIRQEQVSNFLKAVCRKCFTIDNVWGSRHNLNVFLSTVDTYIKLGRQETLNLENVIRKIRIGDFPWLKTDYTPGNHMGRKKPKLIRHVEMQCVFRMMWWIFAQYINPLLSSSFYCTEVEGTGFEVFYYRKLAWSYIVEQGHIQMHNQFVPVLLSDEDHTEKYFNEGDKIAHPIQSSGALSINKSNSKSLLFNDLLKNGLQVASDPKPPIKPIMNLMIPTANSKRTFNSIMVRYLKSIPHVRFLPKLYTVRAITNLKTKMKSKLTKKDQLSGSWVNKSSDLTLSRRYRDMPLKNIVGKSPLQEVVTNSSLYNCLHVLKQVYLSNPGLIGFGAFGLDDIYSKLKSYKELISHSLPETNGHGGGSNSVRMEEDEKSTKIPFYIAVLDLEKCYDNVDTKQLYDLVKQILLDKYLSQHHTNETVKVQESSTIKSNHLKHENVIHRYTVSHAMKSFDKAVTKNVRHVASAGDFIPFEDAAAEIATKYKNSIIADTVVYSKITNGEILLLLQSHLFSHVIQAPRDSPSDVSDGYYTQVKGIPQGSVLSPILCNLYYGNAEWKLFGSEEELDLLGLRSKSVIIRMMDDYIMISTDSSCIQHFLQRIYEGLRPYGGGINPSKTKVNFKTEIEINGQLTTLQQIDSTSHHMPWCGLFIDTMNIEISPNFMKLIHRPLKYSITIETNKIGQGLRHAIKSFIRMKCHAIVLDQDMNSRETIQQNLYSLFLIAAIRTYCYIKRMGMLGIKGMKINQIFLSRCIEEGLLFGARLIHSRTKRRISKLFNFGINETDDFNDNPSNNVDMKDNKQLFYDIVRTKYGAQFGCCPIRHREAIYLGLRAFISVFYKKKDVFMKLNVKLLNRLNHLEAILKRKKMPNGWTLLPDSWINGKNEEVMNSTEWL